MKKPKNISKKPISNQKEPEFSKSKIIKINSLINDSRKEIEMGNLRAKKLYLKIMKEYSQLNKKEQRYVYDKISGLYFERKKVEELFPAPKIHKEMSVKSQGHLFKKNKVNKPLKADADKFHVHFSNSSDSTKDTTKIKFDKHMLKDFLKPLIFSVALSFIIGLFSLLGVQSFGAVKLDSFSFDPSSIFILLISVFLSLVLVFGIMFISSKNIRVAIVQGWKNSNWKDFVYVAFLFLLIFGFMGLVIIFLANSFGLSKLKIFNPETYQGSVFVNPGVIVPFLIIVFSVFSIFIFRRWLEKSKKNSIIDMDIDSDIKSENNEKVDHFKVSSSPIQQGVKDESLLDRGKPKNVNKKRLFRFSDKKKKISEKELINKFGMPKINENKYEKVRKVAKPDKLNYAQIKIKASVSFDKVLNDIKGIRDFLSNAEIDKAERLYAGVMKRYNALVPEEKERIKPLIEQMRRQIKFAKELFK